MKTYILFVMLVLSSMVSAQSYQERLQSLKTFYTALNEGKIVSKTQSSTSSGSVTCQTCFGTGRTQMGPMGPWVACMACGGSGKWLNVTPAGGEAHVVSQGEYNGSNSNGTSTSTVGSQSKTHRCISCNGTGREIRNDATNSSGSSKYCSECGKTVPGSHYHAPCRACRGKGNW